jgi:RNA-directed DNA polymerase
MYDQLISLENIFSGWNEFRKGKQSKPDVLMFERFLEDNIFALHEELETGAYRHGEYKTFHIQDPKPRTISKATVNDRLVHHLVFRQLYAVFDSDFFFHSYASREGKGTHRAVQNLSKCLRRSSKNFTCPSFALKCDVRKFFDSISHKKLLQLIECRISDKKLLRLIEEIVGSFSVPTNKHPLGGGIQRKFFREKRSADRQYHFANFC